MNRVRFAPRASMFARVLRAGAVRWLCAAVLIPLLALGSFGGGRFLVHGCDDHGLHVHPVGLRNGADLSAADHAALHGNEHCAADPALRAVIPSDQDEVTLTKPAPDGVLVLFPPHKQMPTRSIGLGKCLTPEAGFVPAGIPPALSRVDISKQLGPPGRSRGGPLTLSGVSAGERLVRTSRALLI